MIKKSVSMLLCGMVLFCSCGIGGTPQEQFEKGVKLAKEGKVKQAFKVFKSAAKNAPDSARYHFAAAQTAPDQNTAFMYMKFAWEKGLKNIAVLKALLRFSLHVDRERKLEYALLLFKELPDSIATPILKGQLFFDLGKPDSAYVLWYKEFISTQKSMLCPKIATALLRQGKSEEAETFLKQCKKDKILDADGYSNLAALLIMQYKYREVDNLFDEVARSNLYNDQLRLDNATYLVFAGRFKEAEPLLRRGAGPGTPATKALINLRLHTLRLYSAMAQGRRDLFDSLAAAVPRDTVLKNKSVEIVAAIKAFAAKDSTVFNLLKNARSKLPPDPVTTMLTARAALIKKEFKVAAATYAQLPAIVLWSPRIVAERAQALAFSGKDNDALKIISFMHQKKLFTRQSLELFRNLTLKKDLVEKSEAAQKLLEQRYSNDIGLKWKGLLLAIKSEKIDSALIIATQLSNSYPEEERFKVTQLTLLIMKKEYKRVLDELQNSKLPNVKRKPIEAAAWKGLGDTVQAIKAYESAIKDKKEPLLMMQLAEMYFQTKSYKKATTLYSTLLEKSRDSLFKDTLQIAALLNNNAWTIMSAGTKDLSAALEMAKKAHELQPENTHIIDTYVSLLFESEKYKECIKLLENNDIALQQKRLLCHLAKAYEKRGNDNKAKRFLEDALQLKEEEQKLSPLLTDEQIKKEILRLSEKK